MIKSNLNNMYLQIQSYRRQKENSNPRRLTTPTRTQEINKLTPAKLKGEKHTHTSTTPTIKTITKLTIIGHQYLLIPMDSIPQ